MTKVWKGYIWLIKPDRGVEFSNVLNWWGIHSLDNEKKL